MVELLSTEKAPQTDLDQNHVENELNDLRAERLNLSKELDLYLFSISSISKDELHFRATTGLDVSKFIIECTELFCQSPSSLNTQSCLYSSYKSHITDKSLLGIAPSGAVVIFVSQLYYGSISDKQILDRS